MADWKEHPFFGTYNQRTVIDRLSDTRPTNAGSGTWTPLGSAPPTPPFDNFRGMPSKPMVPGEEMPPDRMNHPPMGSGVMRQMPGSMPMGQPDAQRPGPMTPNTTMAPSIPGQGRR